jgi:hypothetical protein
LLKFEAMIKLGMANSRMKDFYDLWVLAQRFEFQSTALAAAIQATFDTRRTSLPVSVPLALRPDFFDLPNKQTRGEHVCERADSRQILPYRKLFE